MSKGANNPAKHKTDAFAAYWLDQAVLRLRRELCWLWRHQRPVDWLAESLERNSAAEQRESFFLEDETARYLQERIAAAHAPKMGSPRRGSFGWVARQLKLTPGETFVMALALLSGRDASAANLFAAVQGEARRNLPTLGLAQWLWDDPLELTSLTAGTHVLYRLGILRRSEASDEWSAALAMPSLVVRAFEGQLGEAPAELVCIAKAGASHDANEDAIEIELLARRMSAAPESLRVVPVAMPYASQELDPASAAPVLKRIAARTGRAIYAPRPGLALNRTTLEMLGTLCWLLGGDVLLPARGLPPDEEWHTALAPFPLHVFAPARGEHHGASMQQLPLLRIPALSLAERLACWRTELSDRGIACDPHAVELCAQRFRLGAEGTARIAASLEHDGRAVTVDEMVKACELEIGIEIGSNAKLVEPRFRREELVLDDDRSRQFDELLQAMQAIAEVHANWGTGRAWGNAGISALFAGAPGTGKTMAAEVLAAKLKLPMYRVDLSQVVNKYIGETEKNLRVLFDAAEQADLLLFFDEADALFGQRTAVKSSNDRWANLEVSYLLERMENFRGLAVLATNRKKDLDEAFLRRLRYVIEFPMPGEHERLNIWRRAIPRQVEADVDFDFLAAEYALAGGNIRSIVLNACLQAAARSVRPRLDMETVMRAVAREYEKLGRPLTSEQTDRWIPAAAMAMRNGTMRGVR